MKTSIHKPQFKTFLLLGILSFLSTAALATIEIQQTINPSGSDLCDGTIVVLAEGSAGPFRLEVNCSNGYQQTIYGVDGSYTLEELCAGSYTIEVFNNYSQQCVRMLEATLGCNPEHPFVKEVKIQATGQAAPYYHAVWEKNASGCYELNILEDNLPGFLTYGGLSNIYFEVKFSKAMSSADLQLDLSGLTAQNSPTYMLSSDGLSLSNTTGANFSLTDTWNPSYSIRLNVSGQDEDGKTLLDMRAMSNQLSSCVILPHENEDCDLPPPPTGMDDVHQWGNGCEEQYDPAPQLVLSDPYAYSCFGLVCVEVTPEVREPYQIQWANGESGRCPVLINQPGVSYAYTLTDGCGNDYPGTFELPEKEELSVSELDIAYPCPGLNNGSISVEGSGGLAPYSYQWTGPNDFSSSQANIGDLAEGSYILTVTDQCGTQAQQIFSLFDGLPASIPAQIEHTCINIDADGIPTDGQSGSIQLQTEDFLNQPLSFQWSNGATTQNLQNLAAGTYEVSVTDGNNCSLAGSFSIDARPGLELNLIASPLSAVGSNDGAVDLTVNGGTAPFVFQWSTGADTEDISGLSVGEYCVTVTDVNGCEREACVIVCGKFNIEADLFHPSCGAEGSISITHVGEGQAPFEYLWSTGAQSSIVNQLIAGSYTVTVADANGCTDEATFILENENAPELIETILPACEGGRDGELIVEIDDGSGGGGGSFPFPIVIGTLKTYSYRLYRSGVNDPIETGQVVSFQNIWILDLAPGQYCLEVTDDISGCIISECYEVELLPVSSISTIDFDVKVACFNASDGWIKVNPSGGYAPYKIDWSDGAQTGLERTDLNAGMYYGTLTDYCGSFYEFSKEVTENPRLDVSGGVAKGCFGETNTAVYLTLTHAGGGNPSYAWSNGSNASFIENVLAGSYSVTVTDIVGCSVVKSFDTEYPRITNIVETIKNTCEGYEAGSIEIVDVEGGTPPFTYNWDAWNPWGNSGSIENLGPGWYDLTVVDFNNCTQSESFFVDENPVDRTYPLGDCTYQDFCNGEAVSDLETQLELYTTIVEGECAIIHYCEDGHTWKETGIETFDPDGILYYNPLRCICTYYCSLTNQEYEKECPDNSYCPQAIIQPKDLNLMLGQAYSNIEWERGFREDSVFDHQMPDYHFLPNPFYNEIQLHWHADKKEKIEFRLLNALGKLVVKQTFNTLEGENQLTVDRLASLPTGVYYVYVIDEQRSYPLQKMIKVQ